MQQPQHPPQFLRKRKFLMTLPLLVLPFLFFWFYSMGGGSAAGTTKADSTAKKFNASLPAARFDRKRADLDKLAIYEQATQDSLKLVQKIRQDPYRTRSADDEHAGSLLQKLGQLRKIVDQPAALPTASPSSSSELPPVPAHDLPSSSSPTRLEKFIRSEKMQDETPADPQMERLNGMLDKILKIQHPGQDKSATDSQDQTRTANATILPLMSQPPDAREEQQFYPAEDQDTSDPAAHNTIGAVVDEDQTLVTGATIKLRLTGDVYIAGTTIRANTLIYGKAAIENDRMMLTIHSVAYDRAVYPVSLQVYDMDGLPGIYIPDAIGREVTRQSADQGINEMGIASFDPSLGAQAANAGIQAGKALLSQKIKLVRVSVRAGYQLLLKNTEQKRSNR